MTDKAGLTTHTFEADVHRVLSLVINSLYSHKEIFLRELVSNASDALDQLQFNAITEPDVYKDDSELVIRLIPDEESGTLTIYDTGVGMTREELIEGLGTINGRPAQERPLRSNPLSASAEVHPSSST